MKFKRFTIPYILWLSLFIVIPLLLIVFYALSSGDSQNFSTFEFSFASLERFFHRQYI